MEFQNLFTWSEVGAIDLWLIVHILWGAVIGLFLIKKGKKFFSSLIISAILIIGWEYGEYLWGIDELWTNIGLDIIIGLVGFVIGYRLPKRLSLDPYVFLIPLTTVVLILNYIGWVNYVPR